MPQPFIVGVKLVVRNREGQFLLVNAPDRGWEVPGGGVEADENLLEALAREIAEETGVTASVDSVCGIYTNHYPPARLMIWFRGTYLAGELTPSDESPELGWFSEEDAIESITAAPVRDRFRDALEAPGGVVYGAFKARSPDYAFYERLARVTLR
mgnify:CR=1 FL=1